MRIRSVIVEPVRVSTAEAELRVVVEWDGPAEGFELRGRLVGPRREGVSTVEVAYPLRPGGTSPAGLILRAIIPEPNLWSPAAPFRYDGRVEVWDVGGQVDSHPFAVELRPAGGGGITPTST
jgi:hypothetical protein